MKTTVSAKKGDGGNTPLNIKMRTSASVLALVALGAVMPAHAQDDEDLLEEVVITGMRASLSSAQNIKRDSNVIQDSIVAEDIGKLPDRSIAEALQRISGVSVSRFDHPGDPEHFAGEGAGVSVRGLPEVRAELNGRSIFSAADGRSLSFEDVPAELMAGVDVYKSPTADMIEGGLGGIVNLRTRMPFDEDGQVVSGTLKGNYGDVIGETNFEGSILYSNNWDTNAGRLGVLVDFSTSETSSRADNLYNRAFLPRTGIDGTADGEVVWAPKGSDWRRNDYYGKRTGKYLAVQWAPVDELEIYVTAFKTQADRSWYENGFFLDAGSLPEPVAGGNDWVYDENNALVSGTLTSPSGIALGTSSRISANDSETTDLAYGFEWAKDNWTISGSHQQILSSAKRNDFTLGTVISPETLSVAGLNSDSGPTIQDGANTLAGLGNYSYGQMMTRPADNSGDAISTRIDVRYDFEDSIISSVKGGARYARRGAINNEGFSWSARVQPWNSWVWSEGAPTISDASLMQEYSFDDFQRGDATVPTDGWMFKRAALADFEGTTAAMAAATPPPEGSEWAVSSPDFATGANLDYYANTNNQEETTNAIYIMADFNIGDRFGGNVGVRYVETENVAKGYFQSPGLAVGDDTAYAYDVQPLDVEHSYENVLPSLNLRYNVTDEVILRFSAAQAMWRPEFWRLKSNLTLSPSWDPNIAETDRPTDLADVGPEDILFELTTDGTNPVLEPMLATQFDVTAEWYFNEDGGMLYAGVFRKDLEDMFREQRLDWDIPIDDETTLSVLSETVINTGTAEVSGFELGGTYYFDSLPSPFDGFGVTANYTYIDSSADSEEEGTGAVDTDGSDILDLPLEGLAENTYNVALMYEKAAFWARLAYNWNSEILQSIGPNGWNGTDNDISWQLPIFAESYGQMDFSMGYDITDNVSVNFEAYNLGASKTKGIMLQNTAGEHTSFVYSQDRRYGLSVRMTY